MKIGMLFPGYGSQFVGMSKELYDETRIIQEYFEQASHCLENNFVKLCFASSDIELRKIQNAYPAIFLSSVATAACIAQAGIQVNLVAGHGIGEYAALAAASGISFADGLYLLNKLALFYNQIKESLNIKSILVIGSSRAQLELLCKQYQEDEQSTTYIAIYESESHHILSGPIEVIDALTAFIKRKRMARVKKYEFPNGLHTPVLLDLEKQLRLYLTKVDFKDLSIPFISSVSLKKVVKASDVENALMSQIGAPLYWHDVIKKFNTCDIILIPSPSKILCNEISSYYPDKKVISINKPSDIELITQLL